MPSSFDELEDVAADTGAEIEPFLRDALTVASSTDAFAEDVAALEEPGVVVGWVHSTNAAAKIILSQHDK